MIAAPPSTEQALLARAAMGDQEAFAQLISAHSMFVYRVVLRILRDHHSAEDTVQEVFLLVWRTLPRLRLRHTFRAWLYRVASNVAISQLRRDRCQPTGLPEELADSGDTLDAHVERAERRTWLADALVTLPEAQRLVLTLRFQAGLSYEEIAALTRRPLGTVKSTLARARERLREMLLTGLPAPHGPEPRAEARSSSGHQGESAYA